jgi:7,8-dihydropterin-6-yl-methyl-4-(beta-D-ribofuranosyl)aminobenzene 5'-phosphate synthase
MRCREIEQLTVTFVTDNYCDTVRRDAPIGKIFRTAPGRAIQAEHGLSYVIETIAEGVRGTLMFDFGVSPQVVINNLSLLGINVAGLEALCLSHGHFDHWGGLVGLLKTYCHTMPAGTPLYVGEKAFAQRFSRRPSDEALHDLGCLDREAIEVLKKIAIIDVKDPVEIILGACLTGKIERTTPYEKVVPTLFVMREGNVQEDDFRGELAVVCNVRGKGLVVISGCAHVGIINTVRHAQKMTGINRVHAVIGGFHLVNAEPEIIGKTIADIKAIGPDYIIPTHCTGFEAMTAFQREMPEQFILNTAGARYIFSS